MSKRLVVKADDVGYTYPYDLGSFKAMDEGIVTVADVMLDAPHVKEALLWLKERPWISIGWHNGHLWESPVLPPEEVPSMVGANGKFAWGHRNYKARFEATYEDCYKEFCAEVEMCIGIYGSAPDTAGVVNDGSELQKAMKDVCDKYGIRYNYLKGTPVMNAQPGDLDKKVGNCDSKYDQYNYWYVPNFFTKPGNNYLNLYDLQYFKDYHPEKEIFEIEWKGDEVYQVFAHPGYLDEYVLQESSCNIHRVRELQCLISPELKQWIIENRIELINQRDLFYGTNEYQNHLKETGSPLWIGNFME